MPRTFKRPHSNALKHFKTSQQHPSNRQQTSWHCDEFIVNVELNVLCVSHRRTHPSVGALTLYTVRWELCSGFSYCHFTSFYDHNLSPTAFGVPVPHPSDAPVLSSHPSDFPALCLIVRCIPAVCRYSRA